jgi:hypothetical protein
MRGWVLGGDCWTIGLLDFEMVQSRSVGLHICTLSKYLRLAMKNTTRSGELFEHRFHNIP